MPSAKLTFALALILLVGNILALLVLLPASTVGRQSVTYLQMSEKMGKLADAGIITIEGERLRQAEVHATGNKPATNLALVACSVADDAATGAGRLPFYAFLAQTGLLTLLTLAAFASWRRARRHVSGAVLHAEG